MKNAIALLKRGENINRSSGQYLVLIELQDEISIILFTQPLAQVE